MRIEPRAYPSLATGSTARPRAGGGAFSLGGGPDAGSAATSTRSAAPLATLDAILMLQEEDPRERRRRSARRGQELLSALDGLKASLLAGAIPASQLRQIAANLGRAAAPSGDPELDEIVAAIELRAKVEMAKLGQF